MCAGLEVVALCLRVWGVVGSVARAKSFGPRIGFRV